MALVSDTLHSVSATLGLNAPSPAHCFGNNTRPVCIPVEALLGLPEHLPPIMALGLAVAATALVFLIAILAVVCFMRRKPAIYCVDSVVCVPPASWQRTHEELLTVMRAQGTYNPESYAFLEKTLSRSATGESTHWPTAAQASLDGKTPAAMNLANTKKELEDVVYPIVEELLTRTRTKPKEVDFLIVNCSLYAPTPSICALICNKFKLRHDVRTYNLGGMGCSANVISVDLAKQLLQNEPGKRALVVSTEMITPNLYMGNQKAMLLQNSLFRCGGVALLLSSRSCDAKRAKYKLLHTQRSQLTDDEALEAVVEQEDEEGHRGVALSKQIVKVAGRAMKLNFTTLAYKVLPVSELARAGLNMALIFLFKKARKQGLTKREVPEAYKPDWSKGIDHFCIHAGGRAVIDGVQEGLALKDEHMTASRQTLHDWGNTSSSSIWYEAEYIERFENLRKGQRLMQVAFGSGFKCNSAVWKTLRVDAEKRGVPIKSEREPKQPESESEASTTEGGSPGSDSSRSDKQKGA